MVAVLLVNVGRSVAVDSIIDAMWGENPPASATGSLQSYVSRLRRRLGAETLVFDGGGYRLAVEPDQVDHLRFEELADRGRALLDAGDAEAARGVLIEADTLWRGPALAEFTDAEFAVGPAASLEQRRLAALDDRFDAELRLGRHGAVVGELAEAAAAQPLREGLAGQLVVNGRAVVDAARSHRSTRFRRYPESG